MRPWTGISLFLALVPLVSAQGFSDDAGEGRQTESRWLRTSYQIDASNTDDPSAQAQAYDDTESLERRVAQLESQLAYRSAPCDNEVLASLDRALTAQDCGTGGLFGSVEVTFLRPRLSGATPAFATNNGGRLIDQEFDTGVRYELGYRTDNGLGVRGRYWSFDEAYHYLPPFGPAQLSIQAQAADAELTLDQRLRNWDLSLSSGVRYGKLRYDSNAAGAYGVGEASFEGFGPTLSMGAKRRLSDSGFALFGTVRGSVLWGEIQNASMLLNMPRGPIRDEIATTFENQLGVSWGTLLGRVGRVEVRTAWETQLWMNETLADDVYGIGSNLGLMGPTVAVEYRY